MTLSPILLNAWNDVEGVHYHYPSKYQGKIKTGGPFVYYRGVHRTEGKRGPAEYVGTGRIGDIWADPEPRNDRRKAYYCGIDDYRRFAVPVPAKIGGVTLEQIPANLWRDGVRMIDPEVFNRILNLAPEHGPERGGVPAKAASIQTADNLIVPPTLAAPGAGRTPTEYRKSRRAKEVGDWAEDIVLRYISEHVSGCINCVHRAALDETPGWDIDYLDSNGRLQRVEVKGTVAAAFTGVDITANELRAARTHGSEYWLYLVAGCMSNSPRVQAIPDPASKLASNDWTLTPIRRGRREGRATRQAISQCASSPIAEVEGARSGHPGNVRLPALVLKI
jgi:uncharacterized protein DUF3883